MRSPSATAILITQCFFAASGPAQQTEGMNPEMLKTLVSVERITGISSEKRLLAEPIGSGFLVITPANHLLLITAKHVVFDDLLLRRNLAYRLNNASTNSDLVPEEHMAKHAGPWFVSTNHDVACRFIVFGTAGFKAFARKHFLAQRAIRPGAPALVIGFPLGLRSESYAVPVVRRGAVARCDEDGTLLDAFVFPGNSGGPVLYSSQFAQFPISRDGIISEDSLLGLVSNYLPFTDVAVSLQTKRPRITFEENSGLATVVPAEKILELIERQDVRDFEAKNWP